jgi:inner membrane protein
VEEAAAVDNVTHTLLGAALAQTGLKRVSRFGTATLLIGANLPDLDGFSYFLASNSEALAFRRGWTHGILALVVLPLLLAGAMGLLGRLREHAPGARVNPRGLLLLAAIGVWSHPLLDLLNVYGIRLLMPFSQHWFKADALFIVDPWVWGLLLLGLVAGAIRRSGAPSRAAIAVFAGYAILMAGLGWAGRSIVARRTGVIARTMAAPAFGNPFRREVLRDLGDHYERGALQFGWPSSYVSTGRVPVGRDKPGAWLAQETKDARWFLRWARFPVFESREEPGGYRVTIQDIRFGRIRGTSWASITVEVPRSAGGG